MVSFFENIKKASHGWSPGQTLDGVPVWPAVPNCLLGPECDAAGELVEDRLLVVLCV